MKKLVEYKLNKELIAKKWLKSFYSKDMKNDFKKFLKEHKLNINSKMNQLNINSFIHWTYSNYYGHIFRERVMLDGIMLMVVGLIFNGNVLLLLLKRY